MPEDLIGENGLLRQSTQEPAEWALEAEMTHHCNILETGNDSYRF